MKIVTKKVCPLCGELSNFKINDDDVLLREAGCEFCGVSLRTADVAENLLKIVDKNNKYKTLKEWRKYNFKKIILNMFSYGKIHESLKDFPNYYYGEFFDDVDSGDFHNGIQCIDLQNMPFKNNTFDFIITEDVFEHVQNIEKGFQEIFRVLKPSGHHVFTVPIHENQITSKRDSDKVICHIDPLRESGVPVITDFGNDLEILLNKYGMETKKIIAHKFFDQKEVSDFTKADQYEYYLNNQDNLMKVFKYNSIVFISTKINCDNFWGKLKKYVKKIFINR